jgi:hypothetical protein
MANPIRIQAMMGLMKKPAGTKTRPTSEKSPKMTPLQAAATRRVGRRFSPRGR